MMMINTTITIAPINRLMGLFTFVSSFSFTRFPKRARTCIQKHSAILPSLAPLPIRLGHHKAGAPIKEPGSFFMPTEFPGIPNAGSLVSGKYPSRKPQPTKEMATEVKEEVSAGQS